MTPEDKAAKRRAIHARYDASPKGRARLARYSQSAKGRARRAAYVASPAWRDTRAHIDARRNPLRIMIGGRYVGRAQTVTQAAAIRAHIKNRMQTFTARQRQEIHGEPISRFTGGEKAESGTIGAVPIETTARGD